MNPPDDGLLTHVYLKRNAADPRPDDAAFYWLTGDGLFLCRNEGFLESAVPAPRPPTELAPQKQFLRWLCPPLSQEQIERAVGFFDWAHTARGAESVLLIGRREASDSVELICPEQTADSYRTTRGVIHPESVRYEMPLPEAGLCIVGDLHSHGNMPAYTSTMDEEDDALLIGAHGVVGQLSCEPPDWHFEAVVDGVRFNMPQRLLFEKYTARRHDYPPEWRTRHRVEYSGHLGPPVIDPPRSSYNGYGGYSGGYSGGYRRDGSNAYDDQRGRNGTDRSTNDPWRLADDSPTDDPPDLAP